MTENVLVALDLKHDALTERLLRVAERTCGALLVVMRTYLEKPRSDIGWKGFLNDPDLDGHCAVERGLLRGRALLAELTDAGLPCATEILEPIASVYLEDALAWAAIGARTAASQIRRAGRRACCIGLAVADGVAGHGLGS